MQNLLNMVIYINRLQKIDQTKIPTGVDASWIINQVNNQYGKCKTFLRNIYKVYNAKAIALLKGLKETLKILIAQIASKIHIYLDKFSIECNIEQILKSFS